MNPAFELSSSHVWEKRSESRYVKSKKVVENSLEVVVYLKVDCKTFRVILYDCRSLSFNIKVKPQVTLP